MVGKKDYTLRVGPPPEFDRRSVYGSRLQAEKQNQHQAPDEVYNSYSFATLMQDRSHFSYIKK